MEEHGRDRYRWFERRVVCQPGDDPHQKRINDNTFVDASSDEIWAAFDALEAVAA